MLRKFQVIFRNNWHHIALSFLYTPIHIHIHTHPPLGHYEQLNRVD